MNTLTFESGKNERPARWCFASSPEVRMFLRRIYRSANQRGDRIKLTHSPTMAEDLEWILMRYPHQMDPHHRLILQHWAEVARDQRNFAQAALTEHHDQPVGLAIPLRDYQLSAAAIAVRNKSLLCGDDLGLGKTAVGIGVIAHPEGRQALVVCPTHLGLQWRDQLAKFVPTLKAYIVKTTQPAKEQIPPCDVVILTYSKLAGWRDHLKPRAVIFDECHALRHAYTGKWNAAHQIASQAEIRLGLSATPIYNYGDEIWAVMECLAPDRLGSQAEFNREWTVPNGRHNIVSDPQALGGHLRNQGVFVRRTRAEVGRELPPINRVVTTVPHEAAAIARVTKEATKLANRVLTSGFLDKGQASRELISLLRHATGLAKCMSVADLVQSYVEEGKQVMLGGWHRDVYDIWNRTFKKRHIRTTMYTGSESAAAKARAKQDFISGEAQVFIISLRSGEGLDGLQEICDTVVVGELDWSPKVIDQLVGRAHRDGQTRPVTVIYPVMEAGSDPVISGVLGLKAAQSDGIVDMKDEPLRQADDTAKGEALANAILKQ